MKGGTDKLMPDSPAHDGRFMPLRTTCLDCASAGNDAKSKQVMRSGCHMRGTDSELLCGPLSVIADRLVLDCHRLSQFTLGFHISRVPAGLFFQSQTCKE
jgi:hypothetical protein